MSRRTQVFLLALLLVAMTLLAYGPAYHANFVDLDDYPYVLRNKHVANGLNWDNIVWAFTKSHSANWHPLTWISHMVDVGFFGLDPHPQHVVNVLFHAVNGVLLFALLSRVTGQVLPSFVVAGLFAIHPLNVESVAWISQRKTTLSTMFTLLSLAAYARYVARREGRLAAWGPYLASLGLFALSLMCKQMMVTMPFALLLVDYWPLERKELAPPAGKLPSLTLLARGWLKLIPDKIPYLLIAIAASAITVMVQDQAMERIEDYPISARFGNAIISYVRYLELMAWPVKLAVFYPRYGGDVTLPRVLASAGVLAVITVVCFVFGRRRRYLLSGWLWYLGTLVPVIGIVQVGPQALADRYMYIPGWGLAVALVWLVNDALREALKSQGVRYAIAGAVAVMLLVLSGLTFVQVSKWHDTVSLFEDAVADTDRNWLAHRTLAQEYMATRQYDLSLKHAEASARFFPRMGKAFSGYGLELYQEGQRDVGIKLLQVATRTLPDDPAAYTNLGWIYADSGRHDLAIEQFAMAAARETEADNAEARRTNLANWANSLAKLNRPREALEKYDQALAIEPNLSFLQCDAGEIDLQLKNYDRALARMQKALTLDPNNVKAIYLLAQTYQAQGNFESAASAYTRAADLLPNNADVTLQLAKVLTRLGRSAEATPRLERLLAAAGQSRDPGMARLTSTIRVQLGDIDSAAKNEARAVEYYQRALSDWSDNRAACNNLAWLLATSPDDKRRDAKRAVTLARRACELGTPPDHAALGTLAAAYAANGQMSDAVKTGREAMALAQKANDQTAVAALERQLQFYEQGQPYIDR